ncbi:MAG: hypothetical protein JST35_12365 [Armatimonadetes bacterium]|nr:hypothetical protein [Armatimonadota bacterium]
MRTFAPKGFESPEARLALAQKLCGKIDAYEASMLSDTDDGGLATSERWSRAQRTYDESFVPSSLQFLPGAKPYHVALLNPRIDGIVGAVCGGLAAARPYFVVSNSEPGPDSEILERALHDRLQKAGFERRVRDAGYQAALKGRGMLRVRYLAGEGLRIDAFDAEDCVVYPTYCESLSAASVVGHRFILRRGELVARQEARTYFADVPVSGDDSRAVVNDEEDEPIICYDLVAKVGDRSYRVTLNRKDAVLLDIEPYGLATPWYFAPAFRCDVGQFWPRRSIADRLMEAQTLYNDAFTLLVLGSAAAAFPSVAVSGFVGQESTTSTGIGHFLFFRGNPQFTPIPSGFRGEALSWIAANIERIADSVSRFGQLGLGTPLRAGATATEANALVMGQQAGVSEYAATFALELERMANHAAELILRHEGLGVRSPKRLLSTCRFELNGKSLANSPQAIQQKIGLFLQGAQALGLQTVPADKAVNGGAAMQALLNALDLPVSTAKILISNDELLANLRSVQSGLAATNPERGAPSDPPGPRLDELGVGADLPPAG